MWTELSDTAILNKLGTRLKASRISSGLKQQELAAESGVGVSTIAKIESPSPMELLKMQGKQVKRVRTKKD